MRPVLVAALLVAALPGAAAWSQWGGDPAHSGRAALGDLDVLGAQRLLPDGVTLQAGGGPGLATTPHGVVGLGRQGNSCMLYAGAPPERLASASADIACPLGGRLAAWDDANGRALVCVDGASTDPLLQSWPIGAAQPAWTHAPGLAAPDPLALGAGQGNADGSWSCRGLAVDGGVAYVPFSSTVGRNRIEAVGLADGTVRWSTSVPADALLQGTLVGTPPALPDPLGDVVGQSTGAFRMDAVALTTTGVVVSGRLDGNPLAQAPPGVAWLDKDGRLQGSYTLAASATDTSAAGRSTLFPASQRPSAMGSLAAALVGDGLFLVDPANAQGLVTPIEGAVRSRPDVPGPCWGDDALLVPGESVGFILPSNDLGTVARWPGYGLGRLQECVVSGGIAWVAVTRLDNGTRTDLLAVDLAAGASTLRLPLPLSPTDAGALSVHLTPLGDGRLLAWDDEGQSALLGPDPAAAPPSLSAASDYPGAQAAALLTVDLPDDAPANTTLLLAWGDGKLEVVQPGTASRTYGTGGDRTARLSAIYPDGRTSTLGHTLHVGQSAPETPGLLTVLFSADYQNYTFFAIGVLITVIGSVVTALGVNKGRKRIDRRLRELDHIQDTGRSDPFAAVRALHAYRQDRRRDLAQGHLDDTQYTVLETHADHVLALLRQRILGNFVGRLSERFTHALDTALADGAFDDAETKELENMVASEGDLSVAERDRLRALVRQLHRDL